MKNISRVLLGSFLMVIIQTIPASALTLPDPSGSYDGLPVAIPYHDFYSYSTQLLEQFGYAGFGSSGVGNQDIVLLTAAGGIDNTNLSTGQVFEDPASSSGDDVDEDKDLEFEGTWGAGTNAIHGPVLVDQLLVYLHTKFDMQANIPVFTFDLVEPGAAKKSDLRFLAKFSIWDPDWDDPNTPEVEHFGHEIASWALDNGAPADDFNPLGFITVQGKLEFTGTTCHSDPQHPNKPCTYNTYTANNTGSGAFDYLVYAPSMQLNLYAGMGYEFHIFSKMADLNGAGEESFISGAIRAPQPRVTAIPEPGTWLLLGLGLLGFSSRRSARS